MDVRESLSYQHQQILRYIELRAQWEGRITANHIVENFNISRDSASKLIKRYNQSCPQNLQYNASLKGYLPTAEFITVHSTGTLEEYISTIAKKDLTEKATHLPFSDNFPMKQFEREPQPDIVRKVLQAIKQNLRMDVRYLSLSSPDQKERIICPHHLIHDGIRWHIRGWCEKNSDYLDFVLSRITDIWDFEGETQHTAESDNVWSTILTLTIEPDVRLKPNQKEIVAYDYSMQRQEDGRYTRSYEIRAAFIIYTMRHLGLDRMREKGEAQQVMLTPESREAIEPYIR
jgi:hypothetical protein